MRGDCPAFVDFHGCTFECSKARHDGRLHVMRVRNSPLGAILAWWYDGEEPPMGPWTGGVVGV